MYILPMHPFDIFFHVFIDANLYIFSLTFTRIKNSPMVYVGNN